MDQPIDPKIRPLVEALNGIDGVRTIASCEGHFGRISDPYVYFHCPPATAESMAARLDGLNHQGRLFHWWTLIGCFNCEHELCFRLHAPALDHGRGTIRTFVNYVLFRKRIDGDLALLADELGTVEAPAPLPASGAASPAASGPVWRGYAA